MAAGCRDCPVDPAKLLPTVTPIDLGAGPGDPSQCPADEFGGYQAQGLQELGADASRAGKVWGEIAADDSANTFQEEANKILHGDPNKIITLPDGTTTTDMGYLGLKGRAALDQRQEYEGRLKKLFEKQQGQMLSFDQQRSFDNLTRRYRAVISSQMGTHANTQGERLRRGSEQGRREIAGRRHRRRPGERGSLPAPHADMVDFATKAAQLRGANPGDAMWLEAQQRPRGWPPETASSQPSASRTPAARWRWRSITRASLGDHYATVVGHFRARAEQANGRDVADRIATGEPPPEGHDAMAVVRHFEGFKDEAYWDVNHHRVGYGSDTITKPDGTVAEVKPGDKVSREDAERDLKRRVDRRRAASAARSATRRGSACRPRPRRR
jgi:hypothetical protein